MRVPVADLEALVTDELGHVYEVRAFGVDLQDGFWDGFLEFVLHDDDSVLVTPRETTHASLPDLVYWATALDAAYLDRALARARSAGPEIGRSPRRVRRAAPRT